MATDPHRTPPPHGTEGGKTISTEPAPISRDLHTTAHAYLGPVMAGTATPPVTDAAVALAVTVPANLLRVGGPLATGG